MATAAAGNLRTIWISIRALNYTQRVFDDIIMSMGQMMTSESKMVTSMKASSDAAMHFIAAGTLMLTLSGMIAMQIYNLAASSQQGASQMGALAQKFTLAQQSLANAAFSVLSASHALDLLNEVLDLINKNPVLAQIVVVVALIVAGLLALAGVIFVVNGVVGQMNILWKFFTAESTTVVTSCDDITIAVYNTNAAMTSLKATALPLLAAFMVFSLLSMWLGPIPSALFAIAAALAIVAIQAWLVAGAFSVMSWGTAAIAGAAALTVAGGVAMAMGAGHQMGTRGLPYTGLFFGHKGEVVYNPATNRPAQIGGDISGGQGETNTYHMPIIIENMHTKSNFDDVNEQMRIALRDKMRGRK